MISGTNVAETQPIGGSQPEAADLRSDLVVELAHDLRSPLTSILFLAESMQLGRSGPITEAQRRQLGLIRSAALCLCATASDVLELTRGGDRLGDQDPAPFSICGVLASVRDLVTPLAEEKRLDLRFLAPELEERIGHERAVARVLLNLTTNALKYTEQGFVEVAAREVGGNRIEFSVRDTGPGMDAEPLRPGTGLRQHLSSSGLGLAICHKLVAALGSELQVATRPGRGTKFSFVVELPPAPIGASLA